MILKTLAACLLLGAAVPGFGNTFFDFENCADGINPPGFLSPLNITIGSIPDNVSLGQTITWTPINDYFRCSGAPVLAWSGTKTLYDESTRDHLINCGGVMSGATILNDPGGESGGTIRLLGVNQVAPNQFRVEVIRQINSGGTTLANCTMTVSYPAGFRFLIVQCTTDADAFDNLQLVPQTTPNHNLNFTLLLNDVLPSPNRLTPITYNVIQGGNILFSQTVNSASASVLATSIPGSIVGPVTIAFDGPTQLRQLRNVTLPPISSNGGLISLLNGDADGSGEVDAADIDLVISKFGTQLGQLNYIDRADLNLSNEVDAADIDIAISNFGATNQ